MKDTPDFYQRQAELRQLLVSKHKPFGWMVMKHSFDMELTHNLQIGMVGDYVHSAKYKEDKNSSFLTLIQPVYLHTAGGVRSCSGGVREWSSREPATPTTLLYGLFWSSSTTPSGIVV